MKALYDDVSFACSKVTTRAYSTSFSIGIHCLAPRLHRPVYAIYGFVRLADEIVDSFHGYDKTGLLAELRAAASKAIEEKISINPVLNSFQAAVNQYSIEWELIDCFLKSMECDLLTVSHDRSSYDDYILGSAESVGLMCLRVFTEGDAALYDELKPAAMRLGAAFQKVNFLRDVRYDYKELGRVYFPQVDLERFGEKEMQGIHDEIEEDFRHALAGIRKLPANARFGVFVAYVYYRELFRRLRTLPAHRLMNERISVPNYIKLGLLAKSYLRHRFLTLS